MKKIDFVYSEEIDIIEGIDVDLSLYGNSNCPEYLQKIIRNMIKLANKNK
jgi:hypothetical protein